MSGCTEPREFLYTMKPMMHHRLYYQIDLCFWLNEVFFPKFKIFKLTGNSLFFCELFFFMGGTSDVNHNFLL